VARSSFVSGVRFCADAAVFRGFGNLADVWFSVGVVHAVIDDSHFACAERWKWIEQRVVADFCFVDGVEFHRDGGAWDCDRAEDGAKSEGGVLVFGGGGDHPACVGFSAGCEVRVR
jgi:hypothetical protein